MNDLSKYSEIFFSILFADETSVFLEGIKYHKIMTELNKDLKTLTNSLKLINMECLIFLFNFSYQLKKNTLHGVSSI